jgi:class 3 adenylate cyclase
VSAEPTIDELLERAVGAINRGDRVNADTLTGQRLTANGVKRDADDPLSTPTDSGEIRRLTMLVADLVDSTALSTRIEPEVYRTVVGGYRDIVRRIVARYEGHIGSTKGDGVLAVFGHPIAHEDDAHRAVLAGIDITREVAALSSKVYERFEFDIDVRVGIHRGLVYLDIAQDDVYGLGANLAARICSLARPGDVTVSMAIERVVRDNFELEARPPQRVKGLDEDVIYYRVAAERDTAGKVRGPLVGRERELAHLESLWAQVSAGTSTTRGLVLCGEGGIGKSRLAGAALDIAKKSGAVVLELFGSPFHTDIGLRPVRRLLERRCGIRRDSDAAESMQLLETEIESLSLNVAHTAPLLAAVLGIDPGTRYQTAATNAGQRFDQIAAAVKEYLWACIGPRPALLLFEDIHWYDEDTVELVNSFLGAEHSRLLVIVTGRRVPALDHAAEVFQLEPLADEHADLLIRALHPELTEDSRKAVQERCDGIPLFIEEVVAKLRQKATPTRDSTQVPDTLYEALVARLRSSTNSLLVVETAALIGSRFDRDLLSKVSGVPSGEIDSLLDELTEARVLRQVGTHSWAFHHELLREVAAELSPPSVRRRLHNRIADALAAEAEHGNPDWSLVAHHFERADRFDDAAQAFRRASVGARQRGALVEARNHLVRALDNIEYLPPSPFRDQEEVNIRLEQGFLATAGTGYTSSEAAAEFERCLQLVSDEPSLDHFGTFSALWGYYTARGQLDQVTRLVDALRRLEGMSTWSTVAYNAIAGSLAMFRGQFHEARAATEAAAAALDQTGAPKMEKAWYAPNDPIAGLYAEVGFIRFIQGDLRGTQPFFERIEGRCGELEFPHSAVSLCYGQLREATVRIEAGQLELAEQIVEEVGARAEQLGLNEWVMVTACNRVSLAARAMLTAGETDPAALQPHIDNMTNVVQSLRGAQLKTWLASYESVLARLHTAAGDRQTGRELADRALQTTEETAVRFYASELLRVQAHTYDDPQARHVGLRAAVDLAHKQGALVFEMRATADDFELIGEPARPALADVLSRFPADQSWPELARARALLV